MNFFPTEVPLDNKKLPKNKNITNLLVQKMETDGSLENVT